MQLSTAVRNGILISAIALAPVQSALAQSAGDIMKKANAIYTGAKTYQATMEMTMAMGQLGSMSTVTEVKSVGNTKVSTKTSSSGKATGQMAMGASGLNIEMVDDGKTMYTYMAAQKKYMKRAHVAGVAGMSQVMPFVGDPSKTKATYTMLPATTVGGKPVYAIEVKVANGASSGMPGMAGTSTVIYIDKSNYHFKQMKVKTGAPAGQGKSMTMDMTMVIKNEKFNEPIPDSVFKFTPPPGATEMTGFGGMMGGAPGAGR